MAFAAISAAPVSASAEDQDAPSIMILGSSHLAQSGEEHDDAEFEPVVEALSAYSPDMVVVEALPPDWPLGRGRDYRPDFDYQAYGEQWGISEDEADEIVARLGRCPELDRERRCRLAKAHFMRRDLANAIYYWLGADCVSPGRERFEKYVENRARHEMERFAFAVARGQGLHEVVAFDYQGDDAKWFLHELAGEVAESEDIPDDVASQFRVLEELKNRYSSLTADEDGLLDMLRTRNSTRWIALQYEVYEWMMPKIRYKRAGRRQTENYWLRNERMFQNIRDAVADAEPERILVVVGAGHKYFLDELARDAGYTWVDPLKYL